MRGRKHIPQQPAGRKRPVDAETLFDCVGQGAARRMHRLLSEGGDRSVRDDAERTLIMRACYIDDDTKREGMVKVLLEHGCDLNSQDELGRTAMTYAALFGRCDVTMLLVAAGADPLIEDVDGNSPLYHCSSVGNANVARLLIDSFCSRGLNVNKRNLQGMTPLLQASKQGHVACAKVLVTKGRASSSLRDLNNFMNAEEWARASGQFTKEDLLALSPVLARKMLCKERRRNQGRKILSDFYGPQAERSDGLIRQSGNTFHFVSHSDPEASASSDEEGERNMAFSLFSASTPNLLLPSLSSLSQPFGGSSAVTSVDATATSNSHSVNLQPKSMFQLPRVKPATEYATVEEPLSPPANVKLQKPSPRMHTIQEEDGLGRIASSSGIRMQPRKHPGESQSVVYSSANNCNDVNCGTEHRQVRLPSVQQSATRKSVTASSLPSSSSSKASRPKPLSQLRHSFGSLSSHNPSETAHSPTSLEKLQQNKSSTSSTGRLGTRPY